MPIVADLAGSDEHDQAASEDDEPSPAPSASSQPEHGAGVSRAAGELKAAFNTLNALMKSPALGQLPDEKIQRATDTINSIVEVTISLIVPHVQFDKSIQQHHKFKMFLS